MKSVLISIQPKWCELIASGKKTVEVRKTKPKLETPFKVYIYCTKDKWQHLVQMPDKSYRIYNGKEYGKYDKSLIFGGEANGKVIGEFVCDEILDYKFADVSTDVGVFYYYERYITQKSYDINSLDDCLTDDELLDYGNYKNLYGWHISDLKIYDKPKELSQFKKINRDCWYADLGLAKRDCHECKNADCFFKRPPQSWCYVEMEAESNG